MPGVGSAGSPPPSGTLRRRLTIDQQLATTPDQPPYLTPPGTRAPVRPGLDSSVTFQSLRHFHASLLIRHGESVKTVQARLGHASAAETLDTYSHLWPDSDDRTRAAVDSVMRASADYVRTQHPL
ncbi:tyrosine-type recombinase/integrase [Geodermatophilus telluris]|uniref:tyrosine-type recombinase/integrase n=1 Tax=Geodermatophilus telluris TaxID=1190417 RepID=UPI000ACD51E3|nr:tyrosine-type recombinase/integrase [Geodermatophilus telluris]